MDKDKQMHPTVSPLRASARRAVALMIIGIVIAGLPSVAAPQFTWPNPDAYDDSLGKTPPPDVDPKAVREAQQTADDRRRRAETQELTALLEDDRQEWQKRKAELDQKLQELDEELAEAIAQAQRDAVIRNVVAFFDLVATAAHLAQQFAPESPTPTDQTPTDSTPPADGLHIQEQYQGIIEVCEGGMCRPVEMRQIINELIRTSGDSPDIPQMRGQLHQVAAKLPSSNDVVVRYDIETESLSLQEVTPVRTPSSLASERPVSPGINSTVPPVTEAGLAKVGIEAGKVLTKGIRKLWKRATPSKKKSIPETRVAKKMDAHWKKHKNEFPEFKNAEEYARAAKEFIEKPPPGTRTFTRRGDGATLRYDPKTNTFGIKHKDGEIGTFFRPQNGEDYWSRQIAKEKL